MNTVETKGDIGQRVRSQHSLCVLLDGFIGDCGKRNLMETHIQT